MLALLAIALAGCAAPDPASTSQNADAEPRIPPPGPRVDMEHSQFVPATLQVPVGSTVTWFNRDTMGHTVAPTDKAHWGSEGSGDEYDDWLDGGELWSFTFTRAGTFDYYCIPHGYEGPDGRFEGMVGAIVVT